MAEITLDKSRLISFSLYIFFGRKIIGLVFHMALRSIRKNKLSYILYSRNNINKLIS